MSSRQYRQISFQVSSSVAHVSLDHPPLNVISITMMQELASVLAEVESRSDVGALVLSGAGQDFSAGVEVAAHTRDKIDEMLQEFHGVIRAIVSTKKVTLAVVHGRCLGGAAELAMVCDFVITTESATWGFPEIKLGCFPPVASAALSVLVGQKRAADLILTGRSITGSEAAAIGLATIAVPDDQLNSAVQEKLTMLCGLSPSTLAIAKKAIYAWDAAHFEKGLARAENIYLNGLMESEDAQEGIRAFLEKRPPKWTGR